MCLADLGAVVRVDAAAGSAEVDLAGRTRTVSLAPLLLDGRAVAPGDWLLVHTGLAIEVLDETDAAEIATARRAVFGADPSTSDRPTGNEEGSHDP